MGRVLFFVLLALAAYVGWQWMRRAAVRDQRDPAVPPSRPDTAPQRMVSCAVCGLHLPRQEALPAGDRFYCCDEHRQRGQAS